MPKKQKKYNLQYFGDYSYYYYNCYYYYYDYYNYYTTTNTIVCKSISLYRCLCVKGSVCKSLCM